jgi:hypothetical protein
VALVDAANPDQSIRFAIAALEAKEDQTIPADWLAASNGVCGINGKSRGQQEDGQETANALE